MNTSMHISTFGIDFELRGQVERGSPGRRCCGEQIEPDELPSFEIELIFVRDQEVSAVLRQDVIADLSLRAQERIEDMYS